MTTFQKQVRVELTSARKQHGNINSLHEGYAVILEELDEFKEEVWKRSAKRNKANMLKELIQIAAMAQRVAEDCGLAIHEEVRPCLFT